MKSAARHRRSRKPGGSSPLLLPRPAAPIAPQPPAESQEVPEPRPKDAPQRLISLDVFRGMTILLMLLVNNAALDVATPTQLTHAPWNGGVRLADFVFPWFLLCMGMAIPFSIASHKRKGLPSWRYDLRAVMRAAGLVGAGCLVDGAIEGRVIFQLGVLQLIGLAYLGAALIAELPAQRRILIAGGLLVGYWGALRYIQVPGLARGTFEENANLIKHLNETYLAPLSLRGVTSVIPTTALALIGTLLGDVMRAGWTDRAKALAILAIGAFLTPVAMIWNVALGYNKPLWTPSYILIAGGTGALAVGLLYVIADVYRRRAWAYPFIVFGSNAIVAYVAPILVKVLILQKVMVADMHGPSVSLQQRLLEGLVASAGRVPGGWLYTAAYIVSWWIVLWILHRRRIHLRI